MSKYAEPNDVISDLRKDEKVRHELGFLGPQNYKYTLKDFAGMPLRTKVGLIYYHHRRIKFPQHTSAKEAKHRLGQSAFDRAVKVSIVRNPFDYLISHFFHSNRRQPSPGTSNDFAQWLALNPWVFSRNNQFYFVDGVDVVDHYIRYEAFNEDILKLEAIKPKLSGLAETFSGISAKAGVRPPRASIQSLFKEQHDLIAAVRFFHQSQLERFNYPLP